MRKSVRKVLRIKDAFSRSWSNLGEVCAGADEGAGWRTGSELCGGWYRDGLQVQPTPVLTNIRHYIMDVNSIS